MLALGLLPLLCYFAFLTTVHLRRTPTVLNGYTDFMLLAWGLFGLITLGPGRLLIPLYVFTAWGMYTWIFWIGFYFVASHFLAMQFRNRLIVYHCRRELLLPALYTLVRENDPKAEWSGNVLSLHGFGVQWAVQFSRYPAPWSGCLVFVPTDPFRSNSHLEMLQCHLTTLCRTKRVGI